MAVYTTIDDAGSFFNIVLYTGTGSSLAVTGVGFQPDFTWIKAREATTSRTTGAAITTTTAATYKKHKQKEKAHNKVTKVRN